MFLADFKGTFRTQESTADHAGMIGRPGLMKKATSAFFMTADFWRVGQDRYFVFGLRFCHDGREEFDIKRTAATGHPDLLKRGMGALCLLHFHTRLWRMPMNSCQFRNNRSVIALETARTEKDDCIHIVRNHSQIDAKARPMISLYLSSLTNTLFLT